VSCGLRVRYIGPELYTSGSLILFREPDNANIAGDSSATGLSFAEMLSSNNAIRVPVTKRWQHVTWIPTREEEYTYGGDCLTQLDNLGAIRKGYAGPDTPHRSIGASPKYSLAIAVTGTNNASGIGSAPFEFEMVQFVEYTGRIPSKTRSHADINGLSILRNTLPTAPSSSSAKSVAASTIKKVWDAGFIQKAGMKVIDSYTGGLGSEFAAMFA
jgi:hypothetical protein